MRAAPRPFAAPVMRAGFASSVRISGVQKRFTEEHEWVSFDDATNIGTVGITDYAQKSLGDVVFIELPEAGAQVKKGGELSAWNTTPKQEWNADISRFLNVPTGNILPTLKDDIGAVESVSISVNARTDARPRY